MVIDVRDEVFGHPAETCIVECGGGLASCLFIEYPNGCSLAVSAACNVFATSGQFCYPQHRPVIALSKGVCVCGSSGISPIHIKQIVEMISKIRPLAPSMKFSPYIITRTVLDERKYKLSALRASLLGSGQCPIFKPKFILPKFN